MIKERIIQVLEYKKIKKGAFYEKIGMTSASFRGDAKKTPLNSTSIENILSEIPDLNPEWLLTGKGEMLKSNASKVTGKSNLINTGNSNVIVGRDNAGRISVNENNPTYQKKEKDIQSTDDADYKLIPIIHVDSVGGIHSNNEIEGEPQYIEGYVPFSNAQKGDIAIYQTGESMIPTCPPGSLLQLRHVPDWREYFGFGNIFVLELKDGRRITKEISRYDENPKEYVWCKSHNPNVPDEELPKDMIVSVWKVIKILTNKGW